MKIQVEIFTVNKRFPLTISRGTTAKTNNVWVKISQDGIEGWGESSPFGVGDRRQSNDLIQESLQQITPQLEIFHPLQRQQIEEVLIAMNLPSSARAALDVALYDWLGKKVGLPLWQYGG